MKRIRCIYTPRWIQYYPVRVGSKPTDDYWRRFHDELESVFRGLCAYCEEYTKGEVDHFKPKSKFPDLVYSWTNWLFVCQVCNRSKLDSWPDVGYVDPSAIPASHRPEHYFAFDTLTGFIVPSSTLTPLSRQKAQATIDDIGLNNLHHLKNRAAYLELLSAAMPHDPSGLTVSMKETFVHVVSRDRPLSSLIRAWFFEHGYPMEDLESE